MYDVFYVSRGAVDQAAWESFKQRVPNAQKAEHCDTFEKVANKSLTKHFWAVWDNIILEDSFEFDYRIPEWDEKYIHVFRNGAYHDGICIFSNRARILQREWDYRFFTNKKEMDIVASQPVPYDVAFISYHEENAETNFNKLLEKAPHAQWTRDVKGIHQAHIEAARKATTDMFYIVDADADVLEDFNFDMQIPYYDFNARKSVYVWRSRNPITDLEYGYGGVKLFPREATLNMDTNTPDMTTSLSDSFRAMEQVSNITAFNTDAFSTWKSAFRECCKLASRTIRGQNDDETDQRLSKWCSDYGRDRPFGDHAINGARAGRTYGVANSANPDALRLINDFDWLKEQFDAGQG